MRFPKRIGVARSQQAMLPSRKAVVQLTHGSPEQQSLGNYSKLTPGPTTPMRYSDIMQEGLAGPKVVPALSPDPTNE